MNQVTLSIRLDEKVFRVLERYAAAAHRDIGGLVNEVLAERLDELSLRTEAEQIRALSLEDRQALARGAWGSCKR